MAVWGIGANWNKQDISEKFIAYKTAAIGWDVEQNSTYHELIEKVRLGDLIFIKARFMMNVPLRIKGIGLVVDTKLCKENGYHGKDGIKVHWIKDLTDSPVDLSISPSSTKSVQTFYREDNPEVIREIINLL